MFLLTFTDIVEVLPPALFTFLASSGSLLMTSFFTRFVTDCNNLQQQSLLSCSGTERLTLLSVKLPWNALSGDMDKETFESTQKEFGVIEY